MSRSWPWSARGFAFAGAIALAGGCFAPQRAELARLHHRAVFDLGCPAEQLYIYHVDARTKAVAGCGRRLVYLEDCDRGAGDVCSWRLDTPAPGQTEWPSLAGQPPPTTATWRATAPGAPLKTELFDAGEAEPQTRAVEGRAFRTDLFSPSTGTLREGLPAKRPIRTQLFERPQPAPPQPQPSSRPDIDPSPPF